MNPGLRQQKELGQTLKQFAFDESPMFQRNHVREMKVLREFVFCDQPILPDNFEKISLDRQRRYASEKTVIELGFRAMRVVQEDSRPTYTFEVSIRAGKLLFPRDLVGRIRKETWDDLYIEFTDNDVDFDAEDQSDFASVLSNDRRNEVIDELVDNGVECEMYQSELLSTSTSEETIESSYEFGYRINDKPHDEDEGSEWMDTVDGEVMITRRNQGFDGPVTATDEFEINGLFDEIIGTIDQERDSLDLMSYEDKRRRVLYVIECLRKKTLIVK